MTTKKPRGFLTYDTYNFKTHDPVIDEYRSIRDREGTGSTTLAYRSRVALTTIARIDSGRTRLPRNATMAALMGAMGYERVWNKTDRQVALVKKIDVRVATEHPKYKPNGAKK